MVERAAPDREITQTDTSPPNDVQPSAERGEIWRIGQVLFDDFAVQRLLGRGGMGEVYLVQSLLTQERYAVKRARVHGPLQRRKFLRELQTWIDLPSHPNLMPLRFARTIADETLLFTEYAEGGSLADWIRQDRVIELPAALRLAVQMAHGLEATHSAHIVHHDVKPANFLLTKTGDVRLSDFGLARARMGARTSDSLAIPRSAGLTLAYCSPEQYARGELGPQTDIWSLGLSILEIFSRGLTWNRGVEAPEFLAAFRSGHVRGPNATPMPESLAIILRRCFAADPSERWVNGGEIRIALSHLYEELCGEPLPAPQAPIYSQNRFVQPTKPLVPHVHLARIMQLAGHHAVVSELQIPDGVFSPQARMIEVLALYQDAQTLWEGLAGRDNSEVQRVGAELFEAQSMAYRMLNDLHGAKSSMARAVALWESLLLDQRDPDVATEYLHACTDYGDLLVKIGQYDRAYRHVIHAHSIIVPILHAEAWHHLDPHIPGLLMVQWAAQYSVRNLKGALATCDHILEVTQDLLSRAETLLLTASSDLRTGVEQFIANFTRMTESTLMNKASVLDDLMRPHEADGILAHVIEARKRTLAIKGHGPETLQDLAVALVNRALVLRKLGDKRSAIAVLERAAELYDNLVEGTWSTTAQWDLVHGFTEARQERSGVAGTMAGILADMERYEEALQHSSKSVAWLEKLVLDEGHVELGVELSEAYVLRAEILASAQRHDESRSAFDKCERMMRQLWTGNPARVSEMLAGLYEKRDARLPKPSGNANTDHEHAIGLYQSLITSGRADLRGKLAHVYLQRARDANLRNDFKSAESAVDQILAIFIDDEPSTQPVSAVADWAEACNKKGILLARRNEAVAAISYYQRGISIVKSLCKKHREQWAALASIHMNLASAFLDLKRIAEAARSYRRAASVYRILCRVEGIDEWLHFIEALKYAAFADFALGNDQTGRVWAKRALAAATEAVEKHKITLPEQLLKDLAMARRKLREMREKEQDKQGVDIADLMTRVVPGGSMNRAFQDFVFLSLRWKEKKLAVLRHEDELLDRMIVMMFNYLLDGYKDDSDGKTSVRDVLQVHWDILQHCRQEGIDAAFADPQYEARLRTLGWFISDDAQEKEFIGDASNEPGHDSGAPPQQADDAMGQPCPCGSPKIFSECHGALDDGT